MAVREEFEKISEGVYDKFAPIVDDPKIRPSMPAIIKQLAYWRIFDPR